MDQLEDLLELGAGRPVPERVLQFHGLVEGDLGFGLAADRKVHLAQGLMGMFVLGEGGSGEEEGQGGRRRRPRRCEPRMPVQHVGPPDWHESDIDRRGWVQA
jgi:hypothetical protein